MLQKYLNNHLVALFLTIIAIIFIISLRQNLQKIEVSQKNVGKLEQQVQKLETEIENKQTRLEKAQQPLAKEKIARDELLLQKDNELVVQLPEIIIKAEEKQAPEEKTSWEKWQEVLF